MAVAPCRTLQKNVGLVKFDKIILCGSIAQADYDWSTALNNGHVNQIFNDYGGSDIWAGLVKHFVSDAGNSGSEGFQNPTNDTRLIQQNHPEWGHSNYFFTGNYEKRWLPFLQGINLLSFQMSLKKCTPLGIVAAIIITALIFIFLLIWFML